MQLFLIVIVHGKEHEYGKIDIAGFEYFNLEVRFIFPIPFTINL